MSITGEQLREERSRLRMTQEELAEELGVSRVTLNRWERETMAIQQQRMLILALESIKRRKRRSDNGR